METLDRWCNVNEKLYTLQEVAQYFRVSTKTIHNWIESGKIKGAKPGRRWLFTEDQVRAVTQGQGESGVDVEKRAK